MRKLTKNVGKEQLPGVNENEKWNLRDPNRLRTLRNGSSYSRMRWIDDHIPMMSEITRERYLDTKDKLRSDTQYFRASPGMLMGMLNAGSTTLGLITQNCKINLMNMKVMTLRSSDNSEGFREYTSWYMEDKFVSQFGVEISHRSQGKNPNDDMYSIIKGTATSISAPNINPLGASARLRIGIDNVRRFWRIVRNPDKRKGISDNVLHISHEGRPLWTPMNCHSYDTVLREKHTVRAK